MKSVDLMKDFLTKYTDDETLIKEISECILATRMPRNPNGLLQQIISDADTYHLGTKDFKTTNKQLRKEYEARGIPEPAIGWRKEALRFLEMHQSPMLTSQSSMRLPAYSGIHSTSSAALRKRSRAGRSPLSARMNHSLVA